MEMLNRATEDAAAFKDMMHKAEGRTSYFNTWTPSVDRAVAEWNAAVERKRHEKELRNHERNMQAKAQR